MLLECSVLRKHGLELHPNLRMWPSDCRVVRVLYRMVPMQ